MMGGFRLLSLSLSAGLLLTLFSSRALPTTIQYQAVDINPGQSLWQYNYFVSGKTFSADQGFTISFDFHTFGQLQSPPPVVNSDWNTIVLQPDPRLPDDGAYDALAPVNGASLADVLRVDFVFLGPGVPGSQPFTINQFDNAGNLVQVLETGNTVPLQQTPVPEPGTLLLCVAGFGAMAYHTVRRQIH